jgi:16S rRNA (cytosine1402-N4)-methyltransferase
VKHGGTYIDATLGGGGHTEQILQQLEGSGTVYGIDRDNDALQAAGKRLVTFGSAFVGIKGCFDEMKELLIQHNVSEVDGVVMDLGVSSYQLDTPERGFSFRADGPLDMRMNQKNGEITAEFLVNTLPEMELVRIIELYGEEPKGRARTIAKAIVAARPLRTTEDLATVVLRTHRGAYQKTHPATRTFQALRIYLNDELGQLERLLAVLPKLLNPGGRTALISFHSLEDRLVKRFFAEQANAGFEAELRLLTKKAIRGKLADDSNPRARSAKLRAAVKI